MKFPIIELRSNNLFVLREFDGDFLGGRVFLKRHNMENNKTRHVIDSNGDLWSLNFVRTNHHGIRKVVSRLIWNISSDQYTYTTEADISVDRFRELVEPHCRDVEPDDREMAIALLEPIATGASSGPLRSHIQLFNL